MVFVTSDKLTAEDAHPTALAFGLFALSFAFLFRF